MEIKLDYTRMADAVFAIAALNQFETGAERIIGRSEEPALVRMFAQALLEVSLCLRPYVTAINTTAGLIGLDISEPLAHHVIESAVIKTVTRRLGLQDDDPQTDIRILRSMLEILPRLSKN